MKQKQFTYVILYCSLCYRRLGLLKLLSLYFCLGSTTNSNIIIVEQQFFKISNFGKNKKEPICKHIGSFISFLRFSFLHPNLLLVQSV